MNPYKVGPFDFMIKVAKIFSIFCFDLLIRSSKLDLPKFDLLKFDLMKFDLSTPTPKVYEALGRVIGS
jgi:hypothetical protein